MSEKATRWSVGRKVFVVLLAVVALGAVSLIALNSAGLSLDRCADNTNTWILAPPFCLGEADPHQPSIAYVGALGLVLVFWFVRKVRS